MAGIEKLFNGHILDKSKNKVDFNDDIYKGKIIGLYFSAHWCPPCRSFTPILIEFYKKYSKEKNFEIIFISSDRNEESFDDYYKDMPWLTLDYNQRKYREELGKKFQVTGIPTFILIDADTGNIICIDGRNKIQHEDINGENFPWKSS